MDSHTHSTHVELQELDMDVQIPFVQVDNDPARVESGASTDEMDITSAPKGPRRMHVVVKFGLVSAFVAFVVVYGYQHARQHLDKVDATAMMEKDRWEDETSSSCSSGAGCCATPVDGSAKCTKTFVVEGDYYEAKREGKHMETYCPDSIDIINSDAVIALLTCSTDDALKLEAVHRIGVASQTPSGAKYFRNALVPLTALLAKTKIRGDAIKVLDELVSTRDDHFKESLKRAMKTGLPDLVVGIVGDSSASESIRFRALSLMGSISFYGDQIIREDLASYFIRQNGAHVIGKFVRSRGRDNNAWCVYLMTLQANTPELRRELEASYYGTLDAAKDIEKFLCEFTMEQRACSPKGVRDDEETIKAVDRRIGGMIHYIYSTLFPGWSKISDGNLVCPKSMIT